MLTFIGALNFGSMLSDYGKLVVKINVLLLVFILVGLSQGCAQKKVSNKHEKLQAVDLKSVFPFMPGGIEDSVKGADVKTIFYYKNFKLFKIPMLATYSSGAVAEEKLDSVKLVYGYIVSSKNSKYGFWYDSLSQLNGRQIIIDSFLQSSTELDFDRFYQKRKGNDTLIYTSINKESATKKYIPKMKLCDVCPDTIIYNFRRDFNDLRFSFSSELDDGVDMKLYRIAFHYNVNSQNGAFDSEAPAQIIYELQRHHSKDGYTGILDLFKRAEAEYNTLNRRK